MADFPDSTIDRKTLLPQLFPNPENYLLLAGLAGTAKDSAAWTQEADNLITLGGAMGAAVSMGLGMALSAPNRNVAAINGDGEMLMGVGSLVTVATAHPQNLTIVCTDNAMHGETGRQTGHTAGAANIEAIARGAGIESTLTISEPDEIAAGAAFIKDAPGPRLLVVRVLPTLPSAFKRDMDMAACRVRFRDHFQANA